MAQHWLTAGWPVPGLSGAGPVVAGGRSAGGLSQPTPLYDPRGITCPALLIRGGADPTSTRSEALRLFDSLGSAEKHYLEIAYGAHCISAERRASEVFRSVNAFHA